GREERRADAAALEVVVDHHAERGRVGASLAADLQPQQADDAPVDLGDQPPQLGRWLGELSLDLVERRVRQPQRAADHARARVDLPDRARVLAARAPDADLVGGRHRASLTPGRAPVSYGAR